MAELLSGIQFDGIIIGLATFLIIGVFHPLVIKGEYYFGQGVKWWFLAAGIVFLTTSLLIPSVTASTLLGVTAFSCFWSIKEVKEQVRRVEKGWFPANPSRKQRNLK